MGRIIELNEESKRESKKRRREREAKWSKVRSEHASRGVPYRGTRAWNAVWFY
jgi:hypothetical protein